MSEKIEVQNVNHPGHIARVDAAKYHVMKNALLQVLPTSSPGLTQKETVVAVVPHLSEDLFPAGKTAGWWAKTVQLDLEAKEILIRENTKPLRWYRA